MGNSASKANSAASGAKSAARHFPSTNVVQERAAAKAAATAAASRVGASKATASSPKQDYLEQQRRLEEEVARYDQELAKSGKPAGESRPLEDTPSAAEMQFFGNLRTLGQVQVPNPDQIKHHEAEEILKRKLPSKSPGSSSSASFFAQSKPTLTHTTGATVEGNLTSLKLMTLLQHRNQDPSVWTVDRLAEKFEMKKEDIQALTKYINTYTIVPGKDAKGRESGVWCEDLRGVKILEKPSSVMEAEKAKNAAAGSSSSSAPLTDGATNTPRAGENKVTL
ncbi:hypothetical protein BG011_004795 [Mortierella polycephala]|uniref:Uncharacterized protein n=1 Tax=Mortierella polycephala TaxID=41804 RepID=A0A9P6QC98_9FUNG|nr:hypothetical protein BG011_004795 [Mortierella polycephala]